jgi:hypothetical protein
MIRKNVKSQFAKITSFGAAASVVGNQAWAASSSVLKPDDFVGISFWLISMALIASTVFFFLERDRVTAKWKTSLTVSGLVTLIAAVHYFYMRDVWVTTGSTPTVFRYIDWLITVPLLMVEFYLILSAITKVPSGVFWRLMISTLVMLIGGYVGEAGYVGDRLGVYSLRDFPWSSRKNQRRERTAIRAIRLQHHALDRNHWLGYLPNRLFLRLPHGCEPCKQRQCAEHHL